VENANVEDKLILNGFITLININDSAVNTENAMIFNDAVIMNKNSGQGKKYGEDYLALFDDVPEEGIISDLYGLIDAYVKYQSGYHYYSSLVVKRRNNDPAYFEEFNIVISKMKSIVKDLREDGDVISSSEVNGLIRNLEVLQEYELQKQPKIKINESEHFLSSSFYIGFDFANYLLKEYSEKSVEILGNELFDQNFHILSAGVDGLDDFLQTNIGSEYADNFHFIFEEGEIELQGRDVKFSVDLYIRRFGTAKVKFSLKMEDKPTTVSDFRMVSTLIGPQVGITKITWNNNEFNKLNDIARIFHKLLLAKNRIWVSESDILDNFKMENVPFNSDSTWFSRSLIRDVGIVDNNEFHQINSYKNLEKSFEFKGIVSPLNEGRPSLDDWIQLPNIPLDNLARIRLHDVDLIYYEGHSMALFLPNQPEFNTQGILSAIDLLNDISTLIISFDTMAEKVRSSLIDQIHNAKITLEEVDIDKIKSDLKKLRKKIIEITEFELSALQSIQLLRGQDTIKYHDHARFIEALINKSNIEVTINNLERKIEMIKQSQEGILRTADDLVAKYQEEVSESQQRLIRVITLIGAGIAQISILDSVLGPLSNFFNWTTNTINSIKIGVIAFAFLLSGLAIIWLGIGYLRSKKLIFGD
ncbi:MAG: hypothetical protein OEY49_19085, partial [Candidatus Heimdallarchaeota archaeon]|nr:hypothetical protein [Candidatus Heimdallarchaeota archaeon]